MRIRYYLLATLILTAYVGSFAQEQKPTDKWASLDGDKIHYYDIGKAKSANALVFIHGWTCNADFWKESYNAFPDYRVIAINLPGHGQSDKPKLNYSIEHFAQSVAAVLKHAKIKQAVFVGHSMGTPVARQFYRTYPKKTLGLVVVDGPLRALAPKVEMDKFIANLRSNYSVNTAKYIDGMLTVITDESMKKAIREGMLATPDFVAVSAIEGMADEKIWTEEKITVPVLAVMAPLAANWPPGIKEAYTSMAPNLEFHEWAGVSHFLMMERPTEFNGLVKSFIVRNKIL